MSLRAYASILCEPPILAVVAAGETFIMRQTAQVENLEERPRCAAAANQCYCEQAATMHPVIPHSASILLIDDEPDMLDEVSAALAQTGYVCRCCQEPRAAEMMARQLLPDLIISDINLGAASGLELCETIKKIEGLANTPVIFLSGAQIPDVVKRSRAAGGAYYLRKPFDPEVLTELVEKALWMPHLVTQYIKPQPIA